MIYQGIILIVLVHACSCMQPNDLSINKLTDKGEIAQVIYASRLIEKSRPIIAYLNPNDYSTSVLLVLHRNKGIDLLCQKSTRYMDVIDNTVGAIATGYEPDIQSMWQYVNLLTQDYHMTFGDTPSIDYYASKLSLWLTRGLYPNDGESKEKEEDDDSSEERNILARPMAASIILSCYDKRIHRCRLVQVDNTGAIRECRFTCLGSIQPKTKEELYKIVCNRDHMEEISDSSSNKSKSIDSNGDIAKDIFRFISEKLELNEKETLEAECIVISPRGTHRSTSISNSQLIFFESNQQISKQIDEIVQFIVKNTEKNFET